MGIQKRKFFKKEIRRTFILYALIPTLIFAVLIFSILFIYFRYMIKEQNRENNTDVSIFLKHEITIYKNELNNISNSDKILPVLEKKNPDKSIAYEYLYDFVNRCKLKSVFYIFDAEGNTVMTSAWRNAQYHSNDYALEDMIKRMNSSPDKIIMMLNRTQSGLNSNKIYSMGKAILNRDKRVIGYMLFDLVADDLNKIIYNKQVDVLVVTDQFDNVIVASNNFILNSMNKFIPSKFNNNYMWLNHDKYYYYRSKINNDTIFVYTLSSTSLLDKFYVGGLIFMCIIFLFMTISIIIIAIRFSESKTKSLYKLLSAIKRLQKGHLNTYVDINSNDEFELLSDYYNEMLVELKKLMKQNREQLRRSNIAEIKQLEAQFNPHYLFNTFEVLKYMIKIDPTNAVSMVICMSDLLRYSINHEKENVKLIDDIKYIRDYLKIQKYRYDDKLTYSINIDEKAENCIVPKLIMQPLIENSIKYGYEKNGSVKLDLNIGVNDEKLVITLTDDGGGIKLDKLESIIKQLNKKENKTTHIGLYNIQRRIQLTFGENYGMYLENIDDKGMKVTISLPYSINNYISSRS
ncbi:MAG: hypothetical protein GY756_06955 [bacterium]|nr:hypothetical protein [bacterium]